MSPEFVERMLWAIVLALIASVVIVWTMWFHQEQRLMEYAKEVKGLSSGREAHYENLNALVDKKLAAELKTQETIRTLNDHVLNDKDRIVKMERQLSDMALQLRETQRLPAQAAGKEDKGAISGLHDMFKSFDHISEAKPKQEPASVQPEEKVDKPVVLPTPAAPEDVPLEIPTTKPAKKATWKPGSWFK